MVVEYLPSQAHEGQLIKAYRWANVDDFEISGQAR